MRLVTALKRFATWPPVAGFIGACVWIATALVAGACLASLLLRSRAWFDADEVLGYIAAFAVAGAWTGCVAATMRGKWKLAAATLVWLVVLLALIAAFSLTYPTVPWLFAGYSLSEASRRVGAALWVGLMLGLPAALLVSLCVVALEPIVRRGGRWALGVVAAVGVLVARGWGINDAVMWVTRLGFDRDWHVGRQVLWGAAVGAIIGALVGALIGGVVGWAGQRKRAKAAAMQPGRSGGPVAASVNRRP